MRAVNLARRPFLNAKPVVRLAAVLWIFGAALLAYNVWLYTRYLTGSASARAQLEAISEELEREENRLERAEEKLEKLELFEQNEKVVYLNRLIAQRTFPWSQLFEDLEEVLPRKVRLMNVSPSVEVVEERRRRRRRRGPDPEQAVTAPKEWVSFRFNAVAESEEAMFSLYENLSASEVFGRPVLTSEALESKSMEIRFRLEVTYLPERPRPLFATVEGEAGGVEAGEVATTLAGATARPGAGEVELDDLSTEPFSSGTLVQPDRPDEGEEPAATAARGLEEARARSLEERRAAAIRQAGGTAAAPPPGVERADPEDGRADPGTGRADPGAGRTAGGPDDAVRSRELGTSIAGTPLLPQTVPSSTEPAANGSDVGAGSVPPPGQVPAAGEEPSPTEPAPPQDSQPVEPGRAASGTPRLQQGGG